MERLILARHGETDWNVAKRVNGDPSVAVGLSAKGRDEARRLGEELRGAQLDLVVTSRFPRAQETAELALDGREVPRLVIAELDDPGYGSFEGGSLDVYREWAWGSPSSTSAPGGGESRAGIVARYAAGFRRVLELPEASLLVVAHSLPVAYALAAREGRPPEPRVPLVANAHPYPFTHAELERTVELMEGWCASPTW
jgi:probable phosphoglycerate mutase